MKTDFEIFQDMIDAGEFIAVCPELVEAKKVGKNGHVTMGTPVSIVMGLFTGEYQTALYTFDKQKFFARKQAAKHETGNSEEKDNFAISFAVWAMHDPQAQSYQAAGITAYDLLMKYKDRPYINTDPNTQ